MTKIDPKIERLLPISFVKAELACHPDIELEAIEVNDWLMERKGGWAGYVHELKKIIFDPTVKPSVICKFANSLFPELCLQEDESWAWALYHEVSHAMGNFNEWECNLYAKQRILELRNKKEAERKRFVDAISEAVAKGIRASFSDNRSSSSKGIRTAFGGK